MVAANFRATAGPDPEVKTRERDAWREFGVAHGFELGPKKNFDSYSISSTRAVELGFGLQDEHLTRVLRSYVGASVHSMPTTTLRTMRITTASDGRPLPRFEDVPAQTHLLLWAATCAVVVASSHVEGWAGSSSETKSASLRDRVLKAVMDI